MKCGACGGDSSREITYKDVFAHPVFSGKKIVVCDSCGLGVTFPDIDSAALLGFYNDYYRSKDSPLHIDFKSGSNIRDVLDYRSFSQLMLGKQFFRKMEASTFLDIGPGPGYSFESAARIFGDIELFAVEANREARSYYKKRYGNIAILEDISVLDNKIDILLMSHSLEHFPVGDLPLLFESIYKAMANHGVMIIEVPNVDLRNQVLESNRANDAPHLCFFTIDSLIKIIEKTKFNLSFINSAGLPCDQYYSKASPSAQIHKIDTNKRLKRKIRNIWKRISGQFTDKNQIDNMFYKNPNFQYGGDRVMIRCVLEKNI